MNNSISTIVSSNAADSEYNVITYYDNEKKIFISKAVETITKKEQQDLVHVDSKGLRFSRKRLSHYHSLACDFFTPTKREELCDSYEIPDEYSELFDIEESEEMAMMIADLLY